MLPVVGLASTGVHMCICSKLYLCHVSNTFETQNAFEMVAPIFLCMHFRPIQLHFRSVCARIHSVGNLHRLSFVCRNLYSFFFSFLCLSMWAEPENIFFVTADGISMALNLLSAARSMCECVCVRESERKEDKHRPHHEFSSYTENTRHISKYGIFVCLRFSVFQMKLTTSDEIQRNGQLTQNAWWKLLLVALRIHIEYRKRESASAQRLKRNVLDLAGIGMFSLYSSFNWARRDTIYTTIFPGNAYAFFHPLPLSPLCSRCHIFIICEWICAQLRIPVAGHMCSYFIWSRFVCHRPFHTILLFSIAFLPVFGLTAVCVLRFYSMHHVFHSVDGRTCVVSCRRAYVCYFHFGLLKHVQICHCFCA